MRWGWAQPSRGCFRCHGTDPKCSWCTQTTKCFDGMHDICSGWRFRGKGLLCTCDCHGPYVDYAEKEAEDLEGAVDQAVSLLADWVNDP